jgi:hypothetical protein
MTEQAVHELWHEAHRFPVGPARFAAYDAALRHADAAGMRREAFAWRLSAMNEFHHHGDPARLFLAFSHCLQVCDTDAEATDGHGDRALLWRFKWVVWSLPQFPEIPLDRTRAVLDDMEARYRRGGHSLHAVYQHRWLVAHHTGDPAADHWYDKLVTAPRDGLSDCAACVPSGQVRHLVSHGRDEEAIELGRPFSRGGCTEQPHWMLSELLLPYLRTGRHADAVDAHRFGYPRMRANRHHLDNIAAHLRFCGLSGNETRGLELIERHRGWLDAPSSPYTAMEFAAAAGQVLRRLTEAGHGDLPVAAVPGGPAASTVAQVGAEVTALAREIAARFDARNGNSHVSSRVEGHLTADPLTDRLSMSVATRPRERMTSAVAALMDVVGEADARGDTDTAATALLDAAYEQRRANRAQDALDSAEEALGRLSRAGRHEDVQRCRLLLWELHRDAHRWPEALEALDAALAAPALPADAPSRITLLLAAAKGDPDRDRAAARVQAAADGFASAGDPGAAFDALLAVTRIVDEAVVERARKLAAAAPVGDDDWRPRRARLALADARRLHLAGHFADAAAQARDGARLVPSGDPLRERLARVETLALLRAGQAEAAEPLARAAFEQDEQWETALLYAAVLHALGRDFAELAEDWSVDEDDFDELEGETLWR